MCIRDRRELVAAVDRAYASSIIDLGASEVTKAVEIAVESFQPPMVSGKVAKIRYAHMGGRNPPRIGLHGSRLDSLPASYVRYLENFILVVELGSIAEAARRLDMTPEQRRGLRRLHLSSSYPGSRDSTQQQQRIPERMHDKALSCLHHDSNWTDNARADQIMAA